MNIEIITKKDLEEMLEQVNEAISATQSWDKVGFKFITETVAAKLLGLSKSRLMGRRSAGDFFLRDGRPIYVRKGVQIYYDVKLLEEWISESNYDE